MLMKIKPECVASAEVTPKVAGALCKNSKRILLL
jgi:hypothetical protein